MNRITRLAFVAACVSATWILAEPTTAPPRAKELLR